MGDAGRYRVLRRIGAGGMAEVLEAVAIGEHGFERRVAIKRLLASAAPGNDALATAGQRMFLDEARLAAQLHHANIVAITDYGLADGQPFQVLEHVDGLDARALQIIAAARTRPMPVEVALHITAMVAQALEYAHDARGEDGAPLGIIHRDVTPANVLVAWSGDVKLTDFGIAFANERVEKTRDGSTKGTLPFMAPEQMLGGEIDRRTDLFSLGCTLHALVAGDSPLSEDQQLVRLAQGEQLELSAALPEDVRVIVARCTRYARRDRYAHASELLAALTGALAARDAIDPRGALRAWLRALAAEPETPAPLPARGKLDALLAGDLVLEPAVGTLRTFVSAPTLVDSPAAIAATALAARADSMAPVASPKAAPDAATLQTPKTPAPAPRARARRGWLVPAAIAGTLGVAAAVLVATGVFGGGGGGSAASHSPLAAFDPSATLTPDDPLETFHTWASKSPAAARDLRAWASAHPLDASALFEWAQARPNRITEVVSWSTTTTGPTLDGFVAAHPQLLGFAQLAVAHPDIAGFLAWAHKHPLAAGNLSRRPRAIGEMGRELAAAP